MQVSVANVQGISKIVLTLSAPADYAIVKEPGAYTVRFKTPIRAPYAEQAHDDPNVAKTSFTGNDLRIQLTAPDVVGDAYKLENPFRVVLDLRKGAAAAPGTPQPMTVDAAGRAAGHPHDRHRSRPRRKRSRRDRARRPDGEGRDARPLPQARGARSKRRLKRASS